MIDGYYLDLSRGHYRRIYSGAIAGKRLCAVSLEAEAWFWRLLLVADDFGNLTADPVLLHQQTSGHRARSTSIDDVERYVAELVGVGLISRYTAAGDEYLAIADWTGRQPSPRNGRRVRRCPASPLESTASDGSTPRNGTQVHQNGECGFNRGSAGEAGGHNHNHNHQNQDNQSATALAACRSMVSTSGSDADGSLPRASDVDGVGRQDVVSPDASRGIRGNPVEPPLGDSRADCGPELLEVDRLVDWFDVSRLSPEQRREFGGFAASLGASIVVEALQTARRTCAKSRARSWLKYALECLASREAEQIQHRERANAARKPLKVRADR